MVNVFLTDKGRREIRPTEIKPSQWAEVAADVVFGSCVVRYGGSIVENVEYSANDYYILFYKQRDEFDFDPYDEVHVEDATLTVRWLPTTGTAPATAQPDSTEALLPQTVNTARYGTPEFEQLSREDCEREVERLQAENAWLKEALKPFAAQYDFFNECARHWGQIGDHKSLRAFTSTALMTSHITNPIDALKYADFRRAAVALAAADSGNGEAG